MCSSEAEKNLEFEFDFSSSNCKRASERNERKKKKRNPWKRCKAKVDGESKRARFSHVEWIDSLSDLSRQTLCPVCYKNRIDWRYASKYSHTVLSCLLPSRAVQQVFLFLSGDSIRIYFVFWGPSGPSQYLFVMCLLPWLCIANVHANVLNSYYESKKRLSGLFKC